MQKFVGENWPRISRKGTCDRFLSRPCLFPPTLQLCEASLVYLRSHPISAARCHFVFPFPSRFITPHTTCLPCAVQ